MKKALHALYAELPRVATRPAQLDFALIKNRLSFHDEIPPYLCLSLFVQAHYSTWLLKSSTRGPEDMANRRTFGLWAAPS